MAKFYTSIVCLRAKDVHKLNKSLVHYSPDDEVSEELLENHVKENINPNIEQLFLAYSHCPREQIGGYAMVNLKIPPLCNALAFNNKADAQYTNFSVSYYVTFYDSNGHQVDARKISSPHGINVFTLSVPETATSFRYDIKDLAEEEQETPVPLHFFCDTLNCHTCEKLINHANHYDLRYPEESYMDLPLLAIGYYRIDELDTCC